MSALRQFQFTLGPVQGFVAQARRTRDFWAGSFILSWLAGVAMREVQAQGGTIVFPKPAASYLGWLDGSLTRGEAPLQGGIPNRFLATVGPDFKPDDVTKAVHLAWRVLAEAVWRADLARHTTEWPQLRAIWERQIGGFWDMSWVLDDAGAPNLLDRRKNWRAQAGTVEPGIKCMVMEGWQELSGVAGPLGEDGKALEQFWQRVRRAGTRGMQTDLAEGEHLCAIAFVKRRFARYFEQVRAPMPGNWAVCGWQVPTGVPSVQYLALVHWLADVIAEADENDIEQFCAAAEVMGGECGETQTRIACIGTALEQHRRQKPSVNLLATLDGSLFFRNLLENARLYPDQRAAARTVQKLGTLADSPPSPFYAVLLMDGDSLGSHMSDARKRPKISAALETFTTRAACIVQAANGFLVYAGGDDVLALLPLEDACGCAANLRAAYLEAFAGTGIDSTLSGAIEFAHVKMPLTRVLANAHTLLDDVAKDGRGRDALAVRVWKPGGEALTWAMPWCCALTGGEGTQLEIEKLADEFRDEERRQRDGGFSSKYLYKVRERFTLLNPPQHDGGGPVEVDAGSAEMLLAVDYLASGVNLGRKPKLSVEAARAAIRPLLAQCRPVIRNKDQPEDQWLRSRRLEEDGALLLRFLVQKGVER